MNGVRNAKSLEFGETPWDDLSREQLLRLVWQYHSSTLSLLSIARQSRLGEEISPYWQPGGSGWKAIEKAELLMRIAGEDSDEGAENIYRCFFRYVNRWLFPRAKFLQGHDFWWICEKCGEMAAAGQPPRKTCDCRARWRKARFSDIRPVQGSKGLGKEPQGSVTKAATKRR